MEDDRFDISVDLVERLIAGQFTELSNLPVTKVEPGGNDNRTFRVGDELSARLPSAPRYVAGVDKEHRWLPALAQRLPLPIPDPVGLGRPGEGFPAPWSLIRWMPGSDLTAATGLDRPRLAADLGSFLGALQVIDATGGPAAGAHCFFRGASLTHYDAETQAALEHLKNDLPDLGTATRVWNEAISTEWNDAPRWFHGDVAPGNLLAERGVLSAVIDFGTCGIGDPACDLVIAWTFFDREQRRIFAREVDLDPATWSRARGWALWKALISVGGDAYDDAETYRVIGEVLADPVVV